MPMSRREVSLPPKVAEMKDSIDPAEAHQLPSASVELIRALQDEIRSQQQSEEQVYAEMRVQKSELDCAQAQIQNLLSKAAGKENVDTTASAGSSSEAGRVRTRLKKTMLGCELQILKQQQLCDVQLDESEKLSGLNKQLAQDIAELRHQIS